MAQLSQADGETRTPDPFITSYSRPHYLALLRDMTVRTRPSFAVSPGRHLPRSCQGLADHQPPKT